MSKKAKRFVYLGCSVVLIVALLPLMGAVFYRDWAFIDENTASRKGYREYWIGVKTGHWYQKCLVEAFIAEKYPNELKQRWTSYAGTGKNIFGTKVLYGHGNPGPIYQIQPKFLNEWIATRSDTDKKAFYDLLVSDDEKAINQKIDYIMEDLFKLRSK